MPTVATQHERHIGKSVGSGQCVAFVREVTGLPPATAWRPGDQVQGADLVPGTAVATFNSAGRYSNATDGSAHAAILLTRYEDGSILVLDQWLLRPVAERVIRNRWGAGKAINDASRYHVVEIADAGDG